MNQPIFTTVRKVLTFLYPTLIIGLSILCTYLYFRKQTAEIAVSDGKARIEIATKVLDRYQDDKGRNHLRTTDNKISFRDYKNKLAVKGGLVDTIAEALNIARKQITELTRINVILVAENLLAHQEIGVTGDTIFRHTDKYADFSFNASKSTFGLKYNFIATVVPYTKGNWFRSKNYVDVYAEDTRAVINSVDRLSTVIPDPKIAVVVQTKLLYNLADNKLYPGIGADVSFGRTVLKGTYSYDFEGKRQIPWVGIGYNFIKFNIK